MALRNMSRLGRGKQEVWLRATMRWQGQLVMLALALLACELPCLGTAQSITGIDGNETPASQGWTSLGLGGGGAMYTPAISPVDPNLILLGCDMSGAYRTTDGGRNWEMIHYRQLNGSTTVRPAWHPTDPRMAWAADGWRGPEGDAGQGTDLGERAWCPDGSDRDRHRPRTARPAAGWRPSRLCPFDRRRENVGKCRAGPRPPAGISLRPHQHHGTPRLLRRHRPGRLPFQ